MKKNNQTPDWNRDKSWDKIEQRLDKKKRRVAPFWWIFGGSAVVALIVGVFIFGLGYSKSVDQLNSDLINQKISDSTDQLISQNPRELNEIQVDTKINTNETTGEIPVQKEVNESLSSNTKTPNQSNTVEKTSIIDRFNEATSINDKRALAPHTNKLRTDEVPPRYREKNLNNELSYADNQKNIIALAGISIPIKTKQLPKSILENRNDIIEIASIDILDTTLTWKKEQLNLPTQLSVDVPISKKEQPNKAIWLWFAESGFDVGNVNHTGENDYSNRKNKTEDFRFASTSTFGIEKEFSKKWYLKSGITFQTIFKKYDATAVSSEVEDVFRDSAFVYILNDGQEYYEPGTVRETTIYNRQIIHNNFIYRLSLPIAFGRKFNFGKMQIAADLGIKPQFYQHFSGIVADENYLHVFDNQTINSTYYKNDFDLGLLANLSARYALTASTQVGLGLRFEKENFLDLRKENFMSRYEMVGGYFGIYRRF